MCLSWVFDILWDFFVQGGGFSKKKQYVESNMKKSMIKTGNNSKCPYQSERLFNSTKLGISLLLFSSFVFKSGIPRRRRNRTRQIKPFNARRKALLEPHLLRPVFVRVMLVLHHSLGKRRSETASKGVDFAVGHERFGDGVAAEVADGQTAGEVEHSPVDEKKGKRKIWSAQGSKTTTA